jgi:hypothetical protein
MARILGNVSDKPVPELASGRRLRGLLRKHQGGTGVVVYGRYFPIRWPADAPEWRLVILYLDGQPIRGLSQYSRGPYWFAQAPGAHSLLIQSQQAPLERGKPVTENSAGILAHANYDLETSQIEFVGFRPPLSDLYRVNRPVVWQQQTLVPGAAGNQVSAP